MLWITLHNLNTCYILETPKREITGRLVLNKNCLFTISHMTSLILTKCSHVTEIFYYTIYTQTILSDGCYVTKK